MKMEIIQDHFYFTRFVDNRFVDNVIAQENL